MDAIENKLKKQCRICLEFDALIDMFEDSTTTYKLELCCGVEILNIPNLPSKICKKCSDILNVAYDFRVLCQRSQEYLSGHEETVDDEEHKPNLAEIDLASYDDIKLDADVYIDNVEEDMEDDLDHDLTDDIEVNILQKEQTEEEVVEEEEEEIFNESDDKSKILPSSKPERKRRVKKFITRAPKKPKTPVTFMCNICGNLYKNKATFTYHMKLHQNDKKYECEICSKRFMQTCELRAHIRVHTGEKPFNCSYCDRKFRDRSGVTRHERTHTNERPYGCTICGAHFSYSATLKKHERVHTGEKPFKCMICTKGFSESHQLKAHLATIRHREMAKENSKLLHLF